MTARLDHRHRLYHSLGRPKRTEQNLIALIGKFKAEVTNNERRRSRYYTAEANYRETQNIVRHICDELCQPAHTQTRRRLRSASSTSLSVLRTWLSTDSDRTFSVAAHRLWNGHPEHVTSVLSLAIFRSRLKTHLFRRCFP